MGQGASNGAGGGGAGGGLLQKLASDAMNRRGYHFQIYGAEPRHAGIRMKQLGRDEDPRAWTPQERAETEGIAQPVLCPGPRALSVLPALFPALRVLEINNLMEGTFPEDFPCLDLTALQA